MLAYRDTTFCISENCRCGRKLTEEIKQAAIRWWGNEDAPIAVANFCDKPKEDEDGYRSAIRGEA